MSRRWQDFHGPAGEADKQPGPGTLLQNVYIELAKVQRGCHIKAVLLVKHTLQLQRCNSLLVFGPVLSGDYDPITPHPGPT